jgi:hypothetical protein
MFKFFSCFSIGLELPSFGCTAKLNFYDVLGAALITPIFVIASVAYSAAVGAIIIRQPEIWRRWIARHVQVGTILIFLVYPGVSATCFKMLLPHKNISGVLYVDSDLSLLANTAEYNTYVALSCIGILVYSIPGIPMYLFFVLKHFRHKIYASLHPTSDLKLWEAFVGAEKEEEAGVGLQRDCRGCMPTRADMAVVYVSGPPLEAERTYTVVDVSADDCVFTLDSGTQLCNDTCEDVDLAVMSLGWLCQNYECEYFYCTLNILMASVLALLTPLPLCCLPSPSMQGRSSNSGESCCSPVRSYSSAPAAPSKF